MSGALLDLVIHITRITFAAGVAFGLGLAIVPRLIDQKWDRWTHVSETGQKSYNHESQYP